MKPPTSSATSWLKTLKTPVSTIRFGCLTSALWISQNVSNHRPYQWVVSFTGGNHGFIAITKHQGGRLCDETAPEGHPTLSIGSDARAPVPLQPGMSRLREDSVSRRNPQKAAYGRGMHPGRRRMRRPGGL